MEYYNITAVITDVKAISYFLPVFNKENLILIPIGELLTAITDISDISRRFIPFQSISPPCKQI